MDVAGSDTLVKLLKRNYEKYGDRKVALRVKVRGVWRTHTWKDHYEKVKYFSLGFISLGMEPGDKVSVLGESKPQWFWAELATHAALGTVVGIFIDCLPAEVKYYVEDSESKFVVTDDQEQVDKLLQIKDELPLLKKVIFWDPKGLWSYDDPILVSFDDVIESGKEYEKGHPGLFENNIEKGKGEDIGGIMYTSGTTGSPKGAMLSIRALIEGARAWQSIDKWRADDQFLSFMSPVWLTDQAVGVGGSLLSGMEISFPEEPETVQENIREVGPQILFWGPRNWESVIRLIQAKIIDTSRLRRFLYHLFLPIGYKMTELRLARRKLNLLWHILYFVANLVVFRALKDKIGLLKVRCAYSAGSALSPDIFRYFQAIGVNVKQLYGSTEMGLVTIHPDDDVRPETCGPIMPGYECRLSEDGEILARSDKLFSGYYRKPEAAEKAYLGDWYRSGDFGHIEEDGHLIVIDRMEDLKELSGGRKFSPQYSEIRLRFSPYIKDALVIGSEDKALVTAITNIDIDNVGRWAEARRIPYTTFADLSQKPEVLGLVAGEIQRVNKNLPNWSRIRRFVNLHKEFDPDEAELTRTRKMRRSFVEGRYQYLIDALYGDKVELKVEAAIVYRDGRKGTMMTSIKINAVD